jgi:hypothetical protein
MQCSNNLKQIGLGIHNFHDARNGLPPTGFLAQRSAFLYVLTPFLEQGSIWEMLTNGNKILNPDGTAVSGTGIDSANGLGGICGLFAFPQDMRRGSGKDAYVYGADWFNALPDDYKQNLSSINWFFCPSRSRSGNRYVIDTNSGGVRTDYVRLVSVINESPESGMDGLWSTGNMQENQFLLAHWCSPNVYDGPFQAPLFTWTSLSDLAGGTVQGGMPVKSPNLEASATFTNWIAGWNPRNDFASWADGTSNQLCLGEKHIPAWAVGNDNSAPKSWDGGYFAGQASLFVSMAVRMYADASDAAHPDGTGEPIVSLARGPNDPATAQDVIGTKERGDMLFYGADRGLGSAHTGIVNFAVGDGSVHGISVTTSQRVLTCLTKVNDGVAVSLP